MAGIPKVKITFDADLDELKKGVKNATTEVDSFGTRVADFGKKAALAFAAAGAAAIAFGVSAVKAAAEDQAAQQKLNDTIKATTDATAQQIAGIDRYVTSISIAAAKTDDEIRPALERLARSTGDVDEAQKLLSLALDLSAASGKSLETTTNALAKANEGSNTALKKLGLGLDENYLKTASNDEIVKQLTETYGNFSENQAATAENRFKSMSIAINESKEAIGAALLPVAEQLATFVLETLIPTLDAFIGGLTGDEGLKASLTESQKDAFKWGEEVKKLIKIIISLKDELLIAGGVIAGIFVVSKISAGITATIAAIKGLIAVYNALKASAIVAGVASAFALNPLLGVAAVAIGAAVLAGANALVGGGDGGGGGGGGSNPIQRNTYLNSSDSSSNSTTGGGGGGGGGGGKSRSNMTALERLTEDQAKLNDLLDQLQGTGDYSADAIARRNALQNFRQNESMNVTINMGVVGDPEGAARAVEQIFQDSLARGGISSTVGAYDR
jgi:cell division protein FtsB